MVEQLLFFAFEPHAMSLSSNKGFTPFSKWILDSDATHHVSYLLSQFISMNLNSSKSIEVANGDFMPLAGIGSVDTPFVALSGVYYISSLTMNLASEVVRTGHMQGDLYVLDHFRDIYDTASSSVDLSSFWLNCSSLAFYLWHSRLGHVSGSRLRFLAFTGALKKIDAHDILDCSGCKLSKFSALPFSNSVSFSNALFDLVHSDVLGPSHVSTKGGSRYYVSFIDDFTRYTWVYLMKRRSDFLRVFKEFRALVKRQHSTVINWFRCDLGGEYTSNDFVGLLESDGTLYQTSCTDTPQQNGVVERKHRHLVETARSFLLSADVSSVFWGEADLTVTYVINRIPTAHNSSLSPFKKLYGTLPDYSSLRVFDCTWFVLKSHVERTNSSSKSTLCVFMGYGISQKGYRCYDPIGQKLYTSYNVQVLEHIPYYSVATSSYNLTQSELIKIDSFEEPIHVVSPIIPKLIFEITSEQTTTETPDTPPQTTTTTETPPITIHEATSTGNQFPTTTTQSSPKVLAVPHQNVRPTRIRKSTKKDDFVYSCYSSSFASFVAFVHNLHEPESYTKAVCDPLWQGAMAKELTALHQIFTWDLVPLLAGKRAIGSR
ncbi:retrovirus-related pol polyprotein from transposon TNT 1-94 [Tanacetum coccineum]